MAGYDPSLGLAGPPFAGWIGDSYTAKRGFIWSAAAVPIMALPVAGGPIDGVADHNGSGFIGFLPGLPVRVESGGAFGVNALLQVDSVGRFVAWMGVGRVVAIAREAATTSGQTKIAVLYRDEFGGFEAGLQAHGGITVAPGLNWTDATYAGATITVANQPDAPYTQCATGASSGTFAGIDETARTPFNRRHNPDFFALISTGADITSVCYQIGLSTTQLNTSGVGSGNHILFRHLAGTDTPSGVASWIASCRDGTTQTQDTVAVAPIVGGAAYLLRIRVDGAAGNIYWSVNSGAEREFHTNQPANNAALGLLVGMKNTAAASRNIMFSRVRVRCAT